MPSGRPNLATISSTLVMPIDYFRISIIIGMYFENGQTSPLSISGNTWLGQGQLGYAKE